MQEASEARSREGQALNGLVDLVEPLGADVMVHLSVEVPRPRPREDLAEAVGDLGEAPHISAVDATAMVARFSARSGVGVGDRIRVAVDTERLHFFDPRTGTAIWKD